jgi:N-acetyl-gamma-glutamyl-phosphate reductase
MAKLHRVGIVGARGHTGAELVALLEAHPTQELVFAGSRQHADKLVGAGELRFEALEPEDVAARAVDAVVLALPDGACAPYVAALPDSTIIVDLSADHRFDDSWNYGLPERNRRALEGARRIANPGCYATLAQLALDPIIEWLVDEPRIFGVSGYSGAGTSPSPHNDPDTLRDNLLPYSPVGHTHEREISRGLGRKVRFMPHVAAFFRGIALTIDVTLKQKMSTEALLARYRARYDAEALVRVSEEAPRVRDAVEQHYASIGGIAVDGTRMVLSATIDNLLKGAATQALQNLNLALGLDEHCGIPVD